MEKEEQETEDEESDLEEDLEEAEIEIEEEKFVEFMAPSQENTAPSLGQVGVATELRATDLEQDLSNVVGLENNNKKEEDDPFKYKIGADPEEGPKYISSGDEIERTALPSYVDVMSLGKKPNLLPNAVGFSASPSTKITEPGPEKYELPDKFDVDKAGKGKLFEKADVKYDPSV